MRIQIWPGALSFDRGWRTCVLGILALVAGCTKTPPDTAAPKKFEVAEEESSTRATPPGTTKSQPGTTQQHAPQTGGATNAVPEAPTAGRPAAAANADGDVPPGPLPGLGAPMKQPPSIPSEKLDAVTVPDGTPEELIGFINKQIQRLSQLQSDITQGKGTPTILKPALTAILTACDKILASNASPEIRKQGIDYKAGVLSMLRRLEPDQPWAAKIREFAQELTADKDPTVAMTGKVVQLGILIGDVMENRNPDIDGLVNHVKSILADEARDASALNLCLQAYSTLNNMGREDQARALFASIADAYMNHSDAQLRIEAENMKEQLLLWDLKLDAKLSDVVRGQAGAEQTFLDAVTQLLQQPKPNFVGVDSISKILPVLEQYGYYATATKICEMAQTTYKNNPAPEVQEMAKGKFEPIAIRLGLVGKPLVLTGKKPDGSPFDFAPYQGKVVLVVFWMTRSPECRPELEKIKAVYEKYHAKGFDVIGVTIDQNAAAVSSFIDQMKLPWLNITNMELVNQFGIEVVPYLLLADAQGNVTRLFLRGSDLEASVAKLLGEPVPTAPTGAPATPPAGAPSAPSAGVNPPNR